MSCAATTSSFPDRESGKGPRRSRERCTLRRFEDGTPGSRIGVRDPKSGTLETPMKSLLSSLSLEPGETVTREPFVWRDLVA
jgi:hypothetical protein